MTDPNKVLTITRGGYSQGQWAKTVASLKRGFGSLTIGHKAIAEDDLGRIVTAHSAR